MVKSLLLIIRYKKFIFIIIFLWFFYSRQNFIGFGVNAVYLLRLFFYEVVNRWEEGRVGLH
jgi:hypothetical protein